MSNVIIYSKPSYVQRTATYRALGDKGVAYIVVDLEQVEQFLALARWLQCVPAARIIQNDSSLPSVTPWSS